MSEISFFLMKPDALKVSPKVLLVWLDLFKQIRENDLSITACASFTMTYNMLLAYNPILDSSLKTMMSNKLKEKIINYQIGEKRQGKIHVILVLQGTDVFKKTQKIKKIIRGKYTKWNQNIEEPENLLHAPDDVQEATHALRLFCTQLTIYKNKSFFVPYQKQNEK